VAHQTNDTVADQTTDPEQTLIDAFDAIPVEVHPNGHDPTTRYPNPTTPHPPDPTTATNPNRPPVPPRSPDEEGPNP
jgi:hypothetical protein